MDNRNDLYIAMAKIQATKEDRKVVVTLGEPSVYSPDDALVRQSPLDGDHSLMSRTTGGFRSAFTLKDGKIITYDNQYEVYDGNYNQLYKTYRVGTTTSYGYIHNLYKKDDNTGPYVILSVPTGVNDIDLLNVKVSNTYSGDKHDRYHTLDYQNAEHHAFYRAYNSGGTSTGDVGFNSSWELNRTFIHNDNSMVVGLSLFDFYYSNGLLSRRDVYLYGQSPPRPISVSYFTDGRRYKADYNKYILGRDLDVLCNGNIITKIGK